MTERALLLISPSARSSLGFVNLCCSANLKQIEMQKESQNRTHHLTLNTHQNLLMEVATIQSDNNVAVPQTSVVCFKVAHILKFALGHAAGTGKRTEKGCREKVPIFCQKSACFSDQHWVSGGIYI